MGSKLLRSTRALILPTPGSHMASPHGDKITVLLRTPRVLRALAVIAWTWSFQSMRLLIVTPSALLFQKYFADQLSRCVLKAWFSGLFEGSHIWMHWSTFATAAYLNTLWRLLVIGSGHLHYLFLCIVWNHRQITEEWRFTSDGMSLMSTKKSVGPRMEKLRQNVATKARKSKIKHWPCVVLFTQQTHNIFITFFIDRIKSV